MRIIVSLQCSQLPIGNWLFDFIKLTDNKWADPQSRIRTTLTLLGAMSFVSS